MNGADDVHLLGGVTDEMVSLSLHRAYASMLYAHQHIAYV